jgi:glycerol-3-phosphate dehydrogenase
VTLDADLLIVGGGINGVGIARDAAGRGMRVMLCEQGDLGCATSSASSKLVHGGLRYLEQLEFRLVAEALREREVLLRAAPHLVHPMRFMMPHTPGLRPAWVIRTGLFLYDVLARRETLPRSSSVDLTREARANGLQPQYVRGYAYSDCRVDDARLVIANARAARAAGASIRPRTRCVGVTRLASHWRARLRDATGEVEVSARALVNAAGPWAEDFLEHVVGETSRDHLKLVQGSHIVVPRLYEAGHACILQNDDRRVIFAYPYEAAFTLIGTTDVPVDGDSLACRASPSEIEYLCRAANRYFARQIAPADVTWSYCGVRALLDDGAANPSKVSRDYLLRLDAGSGRAPLLSIFGGKITTYRRLAERALEKLGSVMTGVGDPWTMSADLPGSGAGVDDDDAYARGMAATRPNLPPDLLRALVRRHGACANAVLGGAYSVEDLGQHFGSDLYAREVDYFISDEWAREGDDVMWRRTKAGLHLSAGERDALVHYVAARAEARVT